MNEALTLKQILREVQAWCQRPRDGEPLANAVENVLPLVHRAADELRLDLNARPVEEGFRNLLEGNLLAYGDIDACLREIGVGLRQHKLSLVEEKQLGLKAAMDNLHENTQSIQEWLGSPEMRCPRCGSRAESPQAICPDCALEYLYPDPSEGERSNRRVLNLGPEYVAVYRAYLDVLGGELPVAVLEQPLEGLRHFLGGFLGLARLNKDSGLSGLTQRVDSLCRDSISGVDQMLACLESRETSDLHDGWSTIFTSAQEMKELMPSLLTGLGVAPERPLQSGDDIVELSD